MRSAPLPSHLPHARRKIRKGEGGEVEVEGGIDKTRGERWRERKRKIAGCMHTYTEAGLDGMRNIKRSTGNERGIVLRGGR